MPVVAVAGGTGALGHAIVDALVAQGGIEVFVLARESKPEKEAEIGAKILAVDYDDTDGFASILEKNNVDTVISTLTSITGPGPELALIKAVEKSSTTKRFIPSQWGIKMPAEVVEYFPMNQGKIAALEALSKTSLEWTAVWNGYFADYYVLPKIKSYFNPMSLVLDIQSDTAAIPGDGNQLVAFTHTFDVAKFVAKLVTLPSGEWKKSSVVIGEKITINDFVKHAEQAKGKKFTITYDDLETLKQGKITELPSHQYIYPYFPKEQLQGFFAAFGRMFATGIFDIETKGEDILYLNDKFQDVKARSVKELVDEAWKA